MERQDTKGVVIVILGSLLFLEVVLGGAGGLFQGYVVQSMEPFVPYYRFRISAAVFCMILVRGFQTSAQIIQSRSDVAA